MKVIITFVKIPKYRLKIDECEWMRGFGDGYLDFLNDVTAKEDFSTEKFKAYKRGYMEGYQQALSEAEDIRRLLSEAKEGD